MASKVCFKTLRKRRKEEKDEKKKQSLEGRLTNLRMAEEGKKWRKEEKIKKYEDGGKEVRKIRRM